MSEATDLLREMARQHLRSHRLTRSAKAKLEDKATELGVSTRILSEIIREVQSELNQAYTKAPKIKSIQKIVPQELKEGEIMRLKTRDEEHGSAMEELLCVDEGWFLVMGHERKILQNGDLLKVVSSPWEVNYVADFNVYRRGSQIIGKGGQDIYRTRRIEEIQLLKYAI